MVYHNIFEQAHFEKKSIMLIGFFDAMHLGHKAIIEQLVKTAKQKDLTSLILTFNDLAIKKYSTQKMLQNDEKLEFFSSFGVDNVIFADFEQIKDLSPQRFIELVTLNYNVSDFLVGQDFAFGKQCVGSIADLKDAGLNVYKYEPLLDENNEKISTKNIKNLILNGEIQKANTLLGRNFCIKGVVSKGKQLGRTLGFPTMNINTTGIRPQSGAYITQTRVDGVVYNSMTFVSPQIIETHVFGYKKFSYNYQIFVDFFKKIC